MKLDAKTYLGHLRAYVNDHYVTDNGTDGHVVLQEKIFFPDPAKRARIRKIKLLLPGPGIAFKLDQEQSQSNCGRRSKPPLFHFLDDNAKPWSKRCDFVVFYVDGKSFNADCIEFKSGSIAGPSIKEQLKAGSHWVRSLKKTIEFYADESRRIRLRKFIFGDKDDPEDYLDANRQLNADPSVRYYHFDEVDGLLLSDLQNESVQEL